MSSPNIFILDESTLPERVVADLQRYLLQRSLIIGEASSRNVNGYDIISGRAVLRGLDCAVEFYCSSEQSLFVLCARPKTFWTFGKCFPEIPNEASVKSFFVGAPPEFKEPLLSKIGLTDSVWVLISAADEKLIKTNASEILAKLDIWHKNEEDASQLIAGLNMFGKPSFCDLDFLRTDDLLTTVLPEKWDLTIQANVEYHDGAPVLSLPIPLVNKELSLGPCKLTELIVCLRTPMYYVRRAPDVCLTAKLNFDNDTSITFTADYPLDDDIVHARLEVEAGKPPPFIDNKSHLPNLTSDIGLTVGVSLSKSDKALKTAYLDLELQTTWPILPGVIEIANPEFHLLVLDPLDSSKRVLARVTGELRIADATLTVSGNYSASGDYYDGQFAVALDPETPLSLAALVKHLLRQDAVPSALREYTLDTLLFEYDLNGHIFMETSVSVPWNIELTSDVSLDFTQLRFLFEKWGDSTRFSARADLEMGGVRFSLSGDYSSESGWLFQGTTYPGDKIKIGTFTKNLAKDLQIGDATPASLSDVSLQDIAFSFNTKTKDLTFTFTTTFPVGEKALDAVVTIEKKQSALEFGGTITVGGAEFTLDFTSSGTEKVLKARWQSEDSGRLNLQAISDDLPDLSGMEKLLMPTKATLTLNLSDGKKSLLLDCEFLSGANAAFLLAQDSGAAPPKWIAALGLKPGRISTESLGPLGSALRPHNIALDKLVVVAASADAPEEPRLPLDKQEYPVTKGLFLQGALEFEETSFSYPFECRLGGEKQHEKPKALPAGDAGEITLETLPPPARVENKNGPPAPEEGKNNVAVERTIGPVTFRKARLESRNKRVYVLLDASLGSGGFELDLKGFNLNFPLTLLQDPKEHVKEIAVGLDGLSIAYSNPPLTISGGFSKIQDVQTPYREYLYEGNLLIRAETFQVTVLGSYGGMEINGETKPSFFVYGTYDGVVGGPPAFYVTGLALGGGYNTSLALPPVEQVAEFPLVQAVSKPEQLTPDVLGKAVQPSYGDYWLAVGVQFNSFKMADSFALFSVSFGTRLQFALLGLTKFTAPTGAEEGKCSVYAELAIRAVLDPKAGVFGIEGRLTQNSYILAKQFRLTGGFAFFVWFGNAEETGDFVISLGGYHRAFLPPPHYPVVPRVGIRGRIGALSVTGEAYLALTPSCLMAGLKLEAVYQSGRIGATFVAYADFIVAWAPFHYDARIGIGLALTIRLWRTFKLEISASLHVWGPPFGGTARVSLWIVSFTVEFGDRSGAQPPPLEWENFQKAFLPSPDTNAGALSTIRITEGLVREVKKQQDEKEVIYRIVNPHELMIETDSAVPCSEVRVGTTTSNTCTTKIGIRPMGATTLNSIHTVSIKANGGSAVENKFKSVQRSKKNFPEALWSPNPASGKPEAGMLKNVPSGVVLRVQPQTPQHRLGPFPIEMFKYAPVYKVIPWQDTPALPTPSDEPFTGITGMNRLRNQIHDCIVNAVAKSEKSRCNDIDLTNTSANPSDHFQAPPTCAALGQSLRVMA